jgi:hypothetical protein
MKLVFLSRQEAMQEFLTPDAYAQNLPLSNLQMICPQNPTLEGYQEIFLNSFGDFTDQEKEEIQSYTARLHWLDLEVKIAKTLGTHSLDITQTRKDIILVTRGLIGEATFIHECYHVLSRKYPAVTPHLAQVFGFTQVPEQTILDPKFLLNPDALVCNYATTVFHTPTQRDLLVTPYVSLGLNTGLKVVDEEEYLKSRDTNYESLIENTSYTAHPEEICAEYFTLFQLGSCIFLKTPRVESKIREYKRQLKVIGDKIGFISGQYPTDICPAPFVWTPEED